MMDPPISDYVRKVFVSGIMSGSTILVFRSYTDANGKEARFENVFIHFRQPLLGVG